MSTAQAELRALGTRILSDTPVRSGYLEAMGGYGSQSGPFARVEMGEHLTPNFGMGGLVQWTRDEWMAGAIAKLTF